MWIWKLSGPELHMKTPKDAYGTIYTFVYDKNTLYMNSFCLQLQWT